MRYELVESFWYSKEINHSLSIDCIFCDYNKNRKFDDLNYTICWFRKNDKCPNGCFYKRVPLLNMISFYEKETK
jgi:hypothetical protein